MDQLSSELSKLKIDKSKRGAAREGRSPWVWIVLILLIVLAAGSGIYKLRTSSAATMVETVRPRLESTTDSAVLIATGYVVPHHKIQVGAKIAGRVAWIGVDKGDRVVKDQLIVRIEDREYRAQYEQAIATLASAEARVAELVKGSRPEEIDRAKAEVQRAEAQLRTDEAYFKRVEGLVREGVAPAQTLDEAKGRYDTSRANLASFNRSLELVEKGPRQEQIDGARSEAKRAAAAVDYAHTILDATEIRVPTAGTILERNVEQGEMVTTSFVGDRGAKSFVVTLADLSDIQVELDISQNDFNRIGASQPCNVVTDAFPDRVYKCRVDEIAPEANRQKATVQVKVKFLAPDEYVKPEMNARVTFLDTSKAAQDASASSAKMYLVPKRAVVERDSGPAVYVIGEGTVQVKPITVEREVGAEVYVSAGLVGSESIIVGERLSELKVGDRVAKKP